ncbi:MAG TPA: MFS transporter [Terriglobales bacterium]|nr:MFS transporter [Terriglobales bacterium]
MKLRLLAVHFAFALTGVVTTMLGPILPLLSARWSLSDRQAGHLFTAQFLSSASSSVVGSKLISLIGPGWTMIIGMFVMAAGVALLSSSQWIVGVGAVCCYGVGLGFALPSTNLFVAQLIPEGRAAALNLLNFFWGVGAVSAPLMIGLLLKPIGLTGLLLLLAFASAAAGIASALTAHPSATPRSKILTTSHTGETTFLLFLTTLLLFIYVGIETALSGWIPTFSLRTHHTSDSQTAILQASFWSAILAGRLTAPLILRRITGGRLIDYGITTMLVGIAVFMLPGPAASLFLGVVVAGLGLSALFPTAVAIFTEWYGTGGAGSIVLGVAGLGGAALPWLVGYLSDKFHSLRVGFLSTMFACVAMIVVHKMSGMRISHMRSSTNRILSSH